MLSATNLDGTLRVKRDHIDTGCLILVYASIYVKKVCFYVPGSFFEPEAKCVVQ